MEAPGILLQSALVAVALFIAAFLIGSIPFGYVIGRVFYGLDIRTKGSGNIGAANALRTLGTAGAVAVLVLDAFKGFLPVFLFRYVGPQGWEPLTTLGQIHMMQALVAIAAVLGHCFSPWLGWRGGKGVATSVGAIFGLSWQAGLASVAAWIVVGLITGFSSAGSIAANAIAPFALLFFSRDGAYALYGFFATVLIIYRHRENIERIRGGRESVLGLLRFWRGRNEGN